MLRCASDIKGPIVPQQLAAHVLAGAHCLHAGAQGSHRLVVEPSTTFAAAESPQPQGPPATRPGVLRSVN